MKTQNEGEEKGKVLVLHELFRKRKTLVGMLQHNEGIKVGSSYRGYVCVCCKGGRKKKKLQVKMENQKKKRRGEREFHRLINTGERDRSKSTTQKQPRR